MKILACKEKLSVDNLDCTIGAGIKIDYRKHGPLLPISIRGLIIGPSNCGKTNVMISLLTHPKGLCFENIYIFSKSLYQPKYEYLKKILNPIKGLGFFTFSNNDSIMNPAEAKPYSVFIFDDVICEKQDSIRSYFSMGRHKNIDSFYLAQTYSKVPKQLIRDNANFLILFKQDEMNLKHIYQDHVSPDVTFLQFLEMCAECWKDKHSFLVIDKDSEINQGRYRKGFDNYINP